MVFATRRPTQQTLLARFLNHEPEYLVLYGDWSDIAHATDAALYVGVGKESKQAALTHLRHSAKLLEQGFFGATFLLRGTRLMLQHFRPDEPGLRAWYRRAVRTPYQRLQSLRVRVVEE